MQANSEFLLQKWDILFPKPNVTTLIKVSKGIKKQQIVGKQLGIGSFHCEWLAHYYHHQRFSVHIFSI